MSVTGKDLAAFFVALVMMCVGGWLIHVVVLGLVLMALGFCVVWSLFLQDLWHDHKKALKEFR